MRQLVVAFVLLLTHLPTGSQAPTVSRDVRERAYRANNRGVALLEQYLHAQAAEAFREALALDPELALARVNLAIALFNVPELAPAEREARLAVKARPDLPQAHYVLALALRGQNRNEEAKAAFREVLRLDPADVGAHVGLGQFLLQERSFAEAIAEFRAALAEQPYNGSALYNLGLALTRAGQAEEGRSALESFRRLREAGYGTFLGQNYPEQGRYAEAIASTGAEAPLVAEAIPTVRFADATAEVLSGAAAMGQAAKEHGAGGIALLDDDLDGDLDLVQVDDAGQRLYRNDGGRFSERAMAGFEAAAGGVGAVAGDLDGDGRPELLVLRRAGLSLYRNDAAHGFQEIPAAAGLPQAPSRSAALADIDHDGDLDIVLGGLAGPERLLRNDGEARFSDVTEPAGLAGARGRVSAVVATDYDNGRDIDLLLAADDGPLRLYRNLRDGRFREVAGEVGLGSAAKVLCAAVGDLNKDSYPDIFLGALEGDLLALSDGKSRFRLAPAPLGSSGTRAAQFLDYDNDGLLDLVAASTAGTRVLRNLGERWQDVSEPALGELAGVAVASFAAGDLDGDGDVDLLLRLASGELRCWRNEGGHRNGSVHVRLEGLVSNRNGVGAKVELRAGSLAQKLETYAATPAPAPADVVFGLGGRKAGDAVRVIWPSGTVQSELGTEPEAGRGPALARLEMRELDRKPSSCPYLYAWNGERFAFVTDFMGGGEMGYYMAPGVWNLPDPVEYVRLEQEQLLPRDGRLELRVTNELEEALFVDRLELLAITHPADVELHPFEGMTMPAKPHRLFGVTKLRTPLAAHDGHGHDVRERIAARDRRYPDDFERHRIRGYAETHSLVLDLGPLSEQAALLLTGWTDYAFSSDNVAAYQAGLAMRPPSLEVEEASGRWRTAIEQLGIPVGRPQTVAADLTGIWLGPSRRVRIVTNMRIYWDEIRVGEIVDAPLETRTLGAAQATLRERGFSAESSPDGREPFGYDYERVSLASPWKAFPGRYTREGDVRELLAATDDVFVVSRPGDEIALSFDAAGLPAPAPGWRRTYLLFSDGFSKEMDINSATPDAIGPPPFHGMTRYPYSPPEAFPMTEARRRLLERYNTRVVGREIPALDVAATAQP